MSRSAWLRSPRLPAIRQFQILFSIGAPNAFSINSFEFSLTFSPKSFDFPPFPPLFKAVNAVPVWVKDSVVPVWLMSVMSPFDDMFWFMSRLLSLKKFGERLSSCVALWIAAASVPIRLW